MASFPTTFVDLSLSCSQMWETALSIPFLMWVGLIPDSTFLNPSSKIALAKMVEVVVPSPAWSLVLLATLLTKLAPMLKLLSGSSMALATVTPSFVILGLP